jgi:hypothetical protein
VRGLVARLGIVGAVIIGGLVLRPFIAGNAGNLQVGDCFDVPESLASVEDVQHHPCTDQHSGEVFFLGKIEGHATLPEDDIFESFVAASCLPAFQAYTGYDLLTTDSLDLGWFQPSQETWDDGARTVICYATNADVTMFTGSLKKA